MKLLPVAPANPAPAVHIPNCDKQRPVLCERLRDVAYQLLIGRILNLQELIVVDTVGAAAHKAGIANVEGLAATPAAVHVDLDVTKAGSLCVRVWSMLETEHGFLPY